MSDIPAITVQELAGLLRSKSHVCLLDVREPDEHAQASIRGSILVPLATIPERAGEWGIDEEVYVHCKAGGRSARAVQYMLSQGFTNVKNITGGMDAWLQAGLPVA